MLQKPLAIVSGTRARPRVLLEGGDNETVMQRSWMLSIETFAEEVVASRLKRALI